MKTQASQLGQIETYTLRESYYVLIAKLVSLELVFLVLTLGIRLGLELLRVNLAIDWMSGYFGLAIGVQVINIWLLITIIWAWMGRLFIIKPNELIVKNGILNSKSISYDLSALQAVTVFQNWIGKWLEFGTIKLYNPILKEDIYLINIHNPEKYANVIKDYEKKGLGFLPRLKAH